jgi:hypothetical protein
MSGFLRRSGVPVRVADQQVGADGAGPARLHRRLAVHLAADDQPGRGLRPPFPAGIPGGHAAGLKLPRVAARTRAQHGRAAVGPRYAAVGARLFDTASDSGHADGGYRGTRTFLAPSSPRRACQPNWLTRREDTSSDAGIRPETGEALAMMRYQDADHPVPGPAGVASFGPAISRLPADADAEAGAGAGEL